MQYPQQLNTEKEKDIRKCFSMTVWIFNTPIAAQDGSLLKMKGLFDCT